MKLEQGEIYKNADFSGRHFKGQQVLVWNDNMLAGANLTDSTWEEMMIPGMSGLLYEANLTGEVDQCPGEWPIERPAADRELARHTGRCQSDGWRFGFAGGELRPGHDHQQRFDRRSVCLSSCIVPGREAAFVEVEARGGALQTANFDDAKLVKTTISCDSPTAFQGVTLNNTEFVECDLSSINADALASCKFDKATPPRYDANTKFPEGFVPQEQGWKRIEAE